MKFLEQYYTKLDDNQLSISGEQGSGFAKNIADDFNPIHNIDSKRFCVPGDLLFSLALSRYGLYEQMSFQFLGLVKADVSLNYPTPLENAVSTKLQVNNHNDKPVLALETSGNCSSNNTQIDDLIRKYVAFSGHNFPHILVPLMKEHDVMINPARPLVIYQSMSLKFESLNFESLDIQLEKTLLDVNGRRGDAQLHFALTSDGKQVGSGVKNLVLSGLRAYEETAMQQMCDVYLASKHS